LYVYYNCIAIIPDLLLSNIFFVPYYTGLLKYQFCATRINESVSIKTR
jgi:hypothetical protein